MSDSSDKQLTVADCCHLTYIYMYYNCAESVIVLHSDYHMQIFMLQPS